MSARVHRVVRPAGSVSAVAAAAVPSFPLSLEMDAAAAAAAAAAEAAAAPPVSVFSAVAGFRFDFLAAAASFDPAVADQLSGLAPVDMVVETSLSPAAAAAFEAAVAAVSAFLLVVSADAAAAAAAGR